MSKSTNARRRERRRLQKLRPFANHYAEIAALVEKESVRGLKSLLSACESPATTNCWWATYGCAPIVRRLVEQELSRRGVMPARTTRPGREGGGDG